MKSAYTILGSEKLYMFFYILIIVDEMDVCNDVEEDSNEMDNADVEGTTGNNLIYKI